MFREAGSTGLRRTGGIVYEEFLPQLQGYRATQVFREMSDNDPVVGAILFAIDKLVRQVKWRVQPASSSPEDKRAAKFVESCMMDMSVSWESTISEILSMLVYGWSLHEIVYKRRSGGSGKPSETSSRYDDGYIGWRKLPIRAQDSRQEWIFDDNGGIAGMLQSAPPDYTLTTIPIEKALLFRTTSAKNNPEGRSILRNAYRPWYFKRRIEEIEAIGVERDLAGFPVMYVDPEIMRTDASDTAKSIYGDYKDAVINIRRDQQEGMILPAIYDDKNNLLYRLELISAGGTRQFDTDRIITRYDQRIATSVLADFILLGQSANGSYALSSDKTNLFAVSLRCWMENIASVFNEFAIPRLFSVNGFPTEKLPTLAYGDIEAPPLGELGNYIQILAGAGVPLFPDDDLENHLRGLASLPEKRKSAKGDMQNVPQQQAESRPRNQAQPAQEPKPQAQPQAETEPMEKIAEQLMQE
ncbi:MAG: hypothetical protein EBU84_07735 [Actinobacteria bacterium]|nr:hypothetical protein [Actinomycetota bacterium]